MSNHHAAVLFARPTSIYKTISGLDVYDLARDARTYSGSLPVIAHPPCRGWGRLRGFAKIRHDELALAYFAVRKVRECGGVLEHPTGSLLWNAAGLPQPGKRDEVGGFTLPLNQSWFGHRAPKSTWLYIVGIEPHQLPVFPLVLGLPSGRIANMCSAERERTPPELANWLVSVAVLCRR